MPGEPVAADPDCERKLARIERSIAISEQRIQNSERRTRQIESDTEQIRAETQRLRRLNAKGRQRLSHIDALCFPDGISSTPAPPIAIDSEPFSR
ncbi:MAG: hypothetical protein ACK55X_00595 [Synechococcaceae cyanobacterium]